MSDDCTTESCGCDDAGTAGTGAESVADAPATLRLDVPDMDCPSCASKVEGAVSGLSGVLAVDPRPTTGTLVVGYDPEATDRETVVAAVEGAGYAVRDDDEDGDEAVWTSARGLKTIASGAFVALALLVILVRVNPVVVTVLDQSYALSDVLLLGAVVAGGQVILRNGYYSARTLSLDIDFLMTAAILAATGITVFVPGENLLIEAASLAFLFNVAELLERASVQRARRSLDDLLDLAPDTAVVRRDGEQVEIPADEVRVGEVVLVQPGEKIPVDGVVRDGESAVNQAPITGESVPVDKVRGDEVYAGTVNEQGYLEVETTSPAGESTLARIVDLVTDAQSNKTERERFVERFAQYYTPLVTGLAVLVAAVPPLFFGADWVHWAVNGIGLLVIACPCAFVISTPVSVVSAVTSAAKRAVLVKGGDRLETMGDVDIVALDKTGTLTTGELAVTDVVPLNGNSEEDVLRCARGLESRSEHPIGDAIVAHAARNGVEHRDVSGFESLTGEGVKATLGDVPHYAGKPGLFTDLGFDLDHVHLTTEGGVSRPEMRRQCEREGCLDLVEDTIPRLQGEGKTVVLVGTEDALEGVIAVSDTIRDDAVETVAALRERGLSVVMLTGDNEGTARAVAEQLGIDEYRADLLPEDKTDAVAELKEQGTVAMVGDGVNDAPALATADVGIAMGAAGSDTAIETADIALLTDDLSRLPYLVDLSRKANSVIRQNVWGSLAVKAALAVLIPVFAIPLWLVVLAGDVGMTTAVTGNAMRLARVAPDEAD
ncbi:heavy metal translocating P-type ATPase [Haloarchaeobius amylolyticus]|uniref:heavy metal translocating P-type ATPase n=1 Tax=Haloarchaeobius amylolyticus TaxID=1198296 RepID=UPI00226EB44A|nr:cation-translocating P-type ATPase [Haloarchaeobius amylolyticus]